MSRPTKHPLGPAPERRRPPEPLDELGRQELPDDPSNPVSPEVPPAHRRDVSASGAVQPMMRTPPEPAKRTACWDVEASERLTTGRGHR